MKYFLSFLVLFSLQLGLAQTVVEVKGVVSMDGGLPLIKGQNLKWGSYIESGSDTAYIKIKTRKSHIVLNSKFKFKMNEPKASETSIELLYGKIRAFVFGNVDKENKFEISTPTAVAGVRGTDFYVSHSTFLGESEVICFEGKVDFGAPKQEATLVTAGQWGGIGGRFGSQVGKPINLPKNILNHFKSSLPLK